MQHPVIREIKQIDNHRFQIIWNDSNEGIYRLSDLQHQCPCAGCVDEVTGERRGKSQSVDQNVQAKAIQNVGRYALRIQFTSGCSSGIYEYKMLHKWALDKKHERKASNFLESGNLHVAP